MNPETVQTINGIFFAVFSSVLAIGALRTLVRVGQYRAASKKIPLLLFRDVLLVGGLALPFVLILASRAFGWAPFLIGQLWWVLLTSGTGLIGVTTYTIFEFLVIDRIEESKPREQREPRELREARETPKTILEPREPREPRPERPPEVED